MLHIFYYINASEVLLRRDSIMNDAAPPNVAYATAVRPEMGRNDQ